MPIPKYKLPSAIYEVVITFAQPEGREPFVVKLLALGRGLTEDDRIGDATTEAVKYAGPYTAEIATPTLWQDLVAA